MVTVVGIAFAVAFLAAWHRPRLLAIVLGASAAFPTTAAVVTGSNALSPFYCVGLVVGLPALWAALRGRVSVRGMGWLIALLAVSIFVTAVAPTLFSKMPILLPRGTIDKQIANPTPLGYTTSMVAQLAYLAVGIGVAAYMATSRRIRHFAYLAAESALWAGVGVSAVQLAAQTLGLGWPDSLFRNYPSASTAYAHYSDRFSGTFSEPSALGGFAVTALAFAALQAIREPTRRRSSLCLAALAIVEIGAAHSGLASAALIVAVIVAVTVWISAFVRGHRRVSPIAAAVVPTMFLGFLVLSPVGYSLVNTVIQKAGATSGAHRLSAELFSWRLFLRTDWLGSGLGSSRPSGFLMMMLSNVGLAGAGAFAAAAVSAVRGAWRDFAGRTAACALMVTLVGKVVAEPALSTPLLWVLLGACFAVQNFDGAQGETRGSDEVGVAAGPPEASDAGPDQIATMC